MNETVRGTDPDVGLAEKAALTGDVDEELPELLVHVVEVVGAAVAVVVMVGVGVVVVVPVFVIPGIPTTKTTAMIPMMTTAITAGRMNLFFPPGEGATGEGMEYAGGGGGGGGDAIAGATGGGGGGGMDENGGGDGWSTGAPQELQNLFPGGTTFPHEWHIFSAGKGAPHSVQNFSEEGDTFPHDGQVFPWLLLASTLIFRSQPGQKFACSHSSGVNMGISYMSGCGYVI